MGSAGVWVAKSFRRPVSQMERRNNRAKRRKQSGWFFADNLAKMAASSPRDLRLNIDRFRFMEGSMGRFSRSWELVEQSFAILWADKQLMLFPVLSGISCVIVSLLLGLSGLAVFLPALRAAGINPHNFPPFLHSPGISAANFLLVLADSFFIGFFKVALVGLSG